jgi:RNA recognition motif-containing protein
VGTKVLISNLHEDVTEAQLKDSLLKHGRISSIKILTDSAGAKTGEAEIVFFRRSDAESVVKLFTGLLLNISFLF